MRHVLYGLWHHHVLQVSQEHVFSHAADRSQGVQKRLQPRYPGVAYIPDRFVVVVLSAILTWHYRLDQHGLAVLGDVNSSGSLFSVHFPFDTRHLKYVGDAVLTGLIIALLGFFESSVAAKSLGSGDHQKDGVQLPLSANRELIALGTANMTGGLFMALPAFGGYGRSKVNASTGGLTPMSNIFLSIITILSTVFLLPYFYYLPKGVLCAMVSVVAYSLVEEAPTTSSSSCASAAGPSCSSWASSSGSPSSGTSSAASASASACPSCA